MKDGRTLVKAIVTDKVGNDSFGVLYGKAHLFQIQRMLKSLILPCDENWDSKYIDANTGDPRCLGLDFCILY